MIVYNSMELIYNLLAKYYDEEQWNIIALILITMIQNIIQTNAVSHFNAKIIGAIQSRDFTDGLFYFKLFIAVWVAYIVSKRIYKLYQNKLLTKLRQWIRFKLTEMVMISNNESLSNVNFTTLTSPISRAATTCFGFVSDIITYIIPNIVFIVVNLCFLFYYNTTVGVMFTIGNLLWMLVIYYYINDIRTLSREYETSVVESEAYLTEVFNNMDKVVARGQTHYENNAFDGLKNATIGKAYSFYSTVSNIVLMTDIIILSTMFACIGYSMYMVKQKSMTVTAFITLFTLFILFREKVTSIALQLSDMVEVYGRSEAILPWFDEFRHIVARPGNYIHEDYVDVDLPFNKITFRDVNFMYPDTTDLVLTNKSLEINTTGNQIIGITGPSGKGKSTIMKLALKLYPLSGGTISIDGTDIHTISPEYIRHHITYINQNSRLFDKTVVENIMYGCSDNDVCKKHYDHIMTYPRIVELFKEIDLTNDTVGYSGERISGGQRQIVNIISGLVNPSKILILDEPTNALDKNLKMELLTIIKYFKQHKQCILIITHDSDVYPLFNEQIKM